MNRRIYLSAVGAALGSVLAGCAGQGGPIKEVSIGDKQITVSIGSGSDIDSLLLLANGNTESDSADVSPGQEQATLSIEGVGEGTHKIVGAKDGSEVASQEVTLDQDYEVRDLQVVETEFNEEGTEPFGARLRATIANTGDVPITVTFFGATEGVLTPSNPSDVLGVKLPSNKHTKPSIQVVPGSEQELETATLSLRYYRQPGQAEKTKEEVVDSACEGTTRTATVTVQTENGSPTTGEVDIRYGGDAVVSTVSNEYGCTDVTVESATL